MTRLRRWIAYKLVRLARRIYPDSEEVVKFWIDRMLEMAITGQSVVKVTSVGLHDIQGSERK